MCCAVITESILDVRTSKRQSLNPFPAPCTQDPDSAPWVMDWPTPFFHFHWGSALIRAWAGDRRVVLLLSRRDVWPAAVFSSDSLQSFLSAKTFKKPREGLDEHRDNNRHLDTPEGQLHVLVKSCHHHLGLSQTKPSELLFLPSSDGLLLTVPVTFRQCESESNWKIPIFGSAGIHS